MLSCLHFISCTDPGMIKMQPNRSVPAVTKPLQPSPGNIGWTFSWCINAKTSELSWATSIPAGYNFILSWKLSPQISNVHAPSGKESSRHPCFSSFSFFQYCLNTQQGTYTDLQNVFFFLRRNQTYTKPAQFLVVSRWFFLVTNQTFNKIQCQSFSWKYIFTYQSTIYSLSFNLKICFLNKLINK